jgi:AraC family transcriptional regulator
MDYFGATVAEKTLGGARLLQKVHDGGESIPAHDHSTPYMSLVLRGRYTEVVEGRKIDLHTGCAVMHPVGERHEDRFAESTDLLVLELPSRLCEHKAFSASRMVEGPAVGRIGAILIRELGDGDDVSEMVVEGAMHELGALLARSRRPIQAPGAVASRADSMIRERFSESISVGTIAEAVGTHPAHLSRAFHQQIGCTVGDRIRSRRVEFICAKLASDSSLSDMALEAGFADQSHMTRVFRRFLGMTPGEYRSALRKNNGGKSTPDLDE